MPRVPTLFAGRAVPALQDYTCAWGITTGGQPQRGPSGKTIQQKGTGKGSEGGEERSTRQTLTEEGGGDTQLCTISCVVCMRWQKGTHIALAGGGDSSAGRSAAVLACSIGAGGAGCSPHPPPCAAGSVPQRAPLQAQLQQRHAHVQAIAGLAEVGGARVRVDLGVDLQAGTDVGAGGQLGRPGQQAKGLPAPRPAPAPQAAAGVGSPARCCACRRTSSTRGSGCSTTASFFSSFMVAASMMYFPLAFS